MKMAGARIEHEKRRALADCIGLLDQTSEELRSLVKRGREGGLDVYEIEELLPLTQRIAVLKRRQERLIDELHAVASEWATD
jgi:hypothetical protein